MTVQRLPLIIIISIGVVTQSLVSVATVTAIVDCSKFQLAQYLGSKNAAALQEESHERFTAAREKSITTIPSDSVTLLETSLSDDGNVPSSSAVPVMREG